MSTLTRLIGNHGVAVLPIQRGRLAGRYVIAFDFFGQWQCIVDEDTGDLRTWKTEWEASVIAEAWRQTVNEMLGQLSETHPLRPPRSSSRAT
ncbi:MAG: hypothetical protein PVSMB4_06070 [Ktedonobacterales bacterium]